MRLKAFLNKIQLKINAALAGGIIGGLLFFALAVKCWYSLYALKTFGKAEVERVKGVIRITGKMLKEAPLILILFILFAILIGKLLQKIIKRSRKDIDKRGFVIASNTSRRPMAREEMKTLFTLDDPENPQGIIYGKDEETGLAITLPEKPINIDAALTNEMCIGFGPSGSRKTSGFILQNIYQFISMGRPMCISDPKGEIYREVYPAAIHCNYKIYILNTIINQGEYSDGVDILKPIRLASDEEADALIDLMVKVILENTSGGNTKEFWGPAVENCLRLVLKIVTRAESLRQELVLSTKKDNYYLSFETNAQGEFRTMNAVYELFQMPFEVFVMLNATLDEHDQRMLSGAYNIWHENQQAAQIKASLATQLNIFANPTLCRILSEDEIDLENIATEKAIIFLECPDGISPYACVLSMFTTMLFYKIENHVDLERAGRALDKPYTVVFEEMANIGRIPNISNYLSTCRSRGIPIYMFFQDISQMQDIYGKEPRPHEWESMLNNCSMKLLMGTADDPTAVKFEKLCGKMRIIDFSHRRQRNLLTKLLSSAEETQTQTEKEVPVYSASELLGDKFPVNKILIVPSQHNALMADKYYYKEHPLYKVRMTDENGNVVTVTPQMHMPKWRVERISKDRRQKVLKEFLPNEKMYTPSYIEGIYEKEEPPEEKKERIKNKIENILFEKEATGISARRIESSHTFADFMQGCMDEIKEDKDTPLKENEKTKEKDLTKRDDIAKEVFDDYEW